jgi:hypothetical protein
MQLDLVGQKQNPGLVKRKLATGELNPEFVQRDLVIGQPRSGVVARAPEPMTSDPASVKLRAVAGMQNIRQGDTGIEHNLSNSFDKH